MAYIDNIKNFYKAHRQMVLAFVYGFFIIFISLYLISLRKNSAKDIINHYNQFRIDISKFGYEIKQNGFEEHYFTQKVYLDVFDVEIRKDDNIIQLENVRIYAPKITKKEVSAKSVGAIFVNNKLSKLHDLEINISLFDNNKLKEITTSIKGDKESELNFIGKRSNQFIANQEAKFIDFDLAVKNSKIDEFDIKILKLSGSVYGNFIDRYSEPNLHLWVENHGKIRVDNLFIRNDDFSLMGKGKIKINERREPSFNFKTASYGLVWLINKLEDRNLLKREKSFIAKIILGNKKSDDRNLITTPIILKNNRLYIDKVELADFTN